MAAFEAVEWALLESAAVESEAQSAMRSAVRDFEQHGGASLSAPASAGSAVIRVVAVPPPPAAIADPL